ncbi:MAG TPA: putative baseplate assembly protein [Thermoanaerobaculia bacterium]|nr:putative baseplate assembly protein [Thermoanaerobaculia bacterium]
MSANCGCCACLAGAGAHVELANRPGLSTLHYRAGTYYSFLDAMIRRLSVPHEKSDGGYSLHSLTTRETDDPAIALLDAWAVTADVLTFYQERIAVEGFLRTATERRSILELGRLVGYTLKPGVSASVYLAYTVDDTAKTVIPAGAKSQSIPGAGEQPQTFETQEDIEARGVWNAMKPRLSKPQTITLENILTLESLWIDGTTTRIDAGEPLLFVFEWNATPVYALRRAIKATIDTERKRTDVALDPIRPYYVELFDAVRTRIAELMKPNPNAAVAVKPRKKKISAAAEAINAPPTELSTLHDLLRKILLGIPRSALQPLYGQTSQLNANVKEKVNAPDRDFGTPPPPDPFDAGALVSALASPAALAPASQWQYVRSLSSSLSRNSDRLPRLLTTFLPQLRTSLYDALAQTTSGRRPQAELRSVHVLRRRTAPFGYNAPTVLFEDRTSGNGAPAIPSPVTEVADALYTETAVDALKAGSYVVFRRQDDAFVRIAREVDQLNRTAYAISAKTTRLGLDSAWASFDPVPPDAKRLEAMITNLAILRRTSVLTQSEPLTLAQQPVDRVIGLPAAEGTTESETRIELDAVVDGMDPGRWVIVAGERDDTTGATGVIAGELAMVARVELVHDAGIGGTAYSALVLAPEGLKYRYKRATVKIYGNVAKADHGETRLEILGGGNAAEPLQTFTLRQTPLTFVSAPTPAGVVTTLAIRVDDVLWHQVDTFAGAAADERVFTTKTANDGKVSVTFGNGREGARVPTGNDNVRGVYRTGIGKPGNVRAKQIATAISRPLGVKDVLNPLKASGGADPESRDDARRNIPVSLQAMDRVVSVQDFADFARTFAGISKASAVALSDGRARVVHLTIGGTGDIDIEVTSDLYRNLVEALRAFGDPYQPFFVQPREKLVIAGSANIRVHPDYLWTSVAPAIRAKLLDVFSYDRRELGQPLFPAEVVAAIQSVPGVTYVDLDALGAIAQDDVITVERPGTTPKPAKIEGVVDDGDSGALPGATIAATNPKTNARFVAISAADGRYSLVVPRGEYRIEVELPGFGAYVRNRAFVRTGETIAENFTLHDARVEDTSANAPVSTSFRVPVVNGVSTIAPSFADLVDGEFRPAQIAYMQAEQAELFILTEITNE